MRPHRNLCLRPRGRAVEEFVWKMFDGKTFKLEIETLWTDEILVEVAEEVHELPLRDLLIGVELAFIQGNNDRYCIPVVGHRV